MKLAKGPKLPAGNGKRAAAGLLQFGAAADVPAVFAVDISRVAPDPDQPRKRFDQAELQQLADSIASQGLLQPILLVPNKAKDGHYIIVAGERRWRASKLANKPTILAMLVQGDPAEVALIENMQRQDLTPLEEARALQRLQRQHGYDQGRLGEIVSKPRETVNKMMRILELPDDMLAELEVLDDRVSLNVLVQIVRMEDPDIQRQAWMLAKEGRLTVRGAQQMGQRTTETPVEPLPTVTTAVPAQEPDQDGQASAAAIAAAEQHKGEAEKEPPPTLTPGPDRDEQADEPGVPRLRPKATPIHETFFRQLGAAEATLERGVVDRSALTEVERARLRAFREKIAAMLDE